MCLHVLLVVCLCTVCMPGAEARRGLWSPWKWRRLWAVFWVLETDLGFLQEQVILIAKPSLQHEVY